MTDSAGELPVLAVLHYFTWVGEIWVGLGLYPPDKQEKAAQTVLEQAQLLALAWGHLRLAG